MAGMISVNKIKDTYNELQRDPNFIKEYPTLYMYALYVCGGDFSLFDDVHGFNETPMRYFIVIFNQNPNNNFYQKTLDMGYNGQKYPNRKELIDKVNDGERNYSIANIIELKSEEDYNNYFK
jgi:hypothetical protein